MMTFIRHLKIKLFMSAWIAVTAISFPGCKTAEPESEDLASREGYENYNSIPGVTCLNAYDALQDGLKNTREEIPSNRAQSEVSSGNPNVSSENSEASTDLSDYALGILMASANKSPCPVEIATNAQQASETQVANPQNSDGPKFGLVNGQSLMQIPKTIQSVIVKIRGGIGQAKKIRAIFADGGTRIWRILRGKKGDLLSSAERIEIFPDSNKVVIPTGPKLVKSEVLESSRYNILIRSLEANRVDNLSKFKNWLTSDLKSVKIIKSSDYLLPSKDPNMVRGMEAIFNVMSDPTLIMRHLQNLEIEIAKRMASKGETMEDALEAILTATEQKHKFLPAYDLKNLSQESFMNPALFRDKKFSAGSSHGIQIHRIQWNVVMRHIDETPALKGKVLASKLYLQFGEGVPKKEPVVKPASWADGWNDLFDGFDFANNNFGRPENWRYNFTKFLPTLAGWP